MKSRAVWVAVVGTVLGVAAAAAVPASAHAESKIVLESYTGERPGNAGKILAPLFEDLSVKGFDVGYDGLGRRFEAQVSRASRAPAGLPGNFKSTIAAGHTAWGDGAFDKAVSILSPAVDAAHDNAAAIAQSVELRDLVRGALLDLALANGRRGDLDAATAAMAELIRSYPDPAITRRDGPEALALFTKTKTELTANGLGALFVEVADTGTQVFINEQFQRNGDVRAEKLMPGLYRVYAALGQVEGRTYQVEVKPNAESRIRIDIELDASLHVDSTWVGLQYDTDAERDRLQGKHAIAVAKLMGAAAVTLVYNQERNDRQYLVGALVSMESGAEIDHGGLPLDPPPNGDRLRKLSRFLAGDASAADDVKLPALRVGPRTRSRFGVFKYLTMAVGVGVAATGGVLLYLDGKCKTGEAPSCPDVYENTTPGWALVGGGALVIGIGIYMFVTDTVIVPEMPVAITPTDGGATASAHWRF